MQAYPEMGDAYFALLFMELVCGLENQLQVQAVKENWLMNYELRYVFHALSYMSWNFLFCFFFPFSFCYR